jgi:cell division protein FtsW
MYKSFLNLFKGDKVVWMVFFLLSIVSVIEVFSASSTLAYKADYFWDPVAKHVGILLFGLFCMIVTLNIKCKYFKVVTPFMLVFSYVMLLWVLFAGHATNDAARWVNFFGLKFQPSEIAKGTMVLLTAKILGDTQTDNGADRHAFKWILLLCGGMIALIAPENLSTAGLMLLTIIMMMFIGRVPGRQLGALVSVLVIIGVIALASIMLVGDTDDAKKQRQQAATEVLADGSAAVEKKESIGEKIFHRASAWKRRIYDFVNSETVPPDSVDLQQKGAQVSFSNIAIASSGGVGVMPGNSETRDFLPQAFSDFIFSIIIEEMGVIGLVLIPLLYMILLYRAGVIARRCENNFPAFLVMGLALMLVTQALINMCVAVGLAPVTGQPLPLVSKGGTSSVINCIYIGVILSVSRSAKKRVQ